MPSIIHINLFVQRIPSEFVTKHMTPTPKYVTFSPEDKSVWAITITKHMGESYFSHGWAEFKQRYKIALRHSVEFDYDGETHFQIGLFLRNDME